MSRPLPEVGGVLDQDYMISWAFGILDKAYHEEQELQRTMETQQKEREQMRQSLLAKARQ